MIFGGFFEEEPRLRPRPRFNDADKAFVYERQKGRCNGCKEKLPVKVMQMDHIIPYSRGGSDKPSNLQLLCGPCNGSKGAGTQAQFEKRLKAGKVKGAGKTPTKAKATANKPTAKKATVAKKTAAKSAAKKGVAKSTTTTRKKATRPKREPDLIETIFGF